MKPKGQLLEGGLALGSPEIEYKVLLLKNDSWSLQRLADHTSEGLQQPGPPAPQGLRRREGVPMWEKSEPHRGARRASHWACRGLSVWEHFSLFRTRHMIRVTF